MKYYIGHFAERNNDKAFIVLAASPDSFVADFIAKCYNDEVRKGSALCDVEVVCADSLTNVKVVF